MGCSGKFLKLNMVVEGFRQEDLDSHEAEDERRNPETDRRRIGQGRWVFDGLQSQINMVCPMLLRI